MENFSISLLAFLVLLAPRLGSADWKGRLEIEGAGTESGKPTPGRIYAKGNRLRVEVQAHGQDAIILADLKNAKASMLMPAQKLAMEMPASMSDKKLVSCPTGDIVACLKRKGFKQVGSETVDGHPCSIFEGDEVSGKHKAHQKIWHPNDLKEVFMVKSETKTENGHDVIAHVKDIQVAKLDDALFKVPADFHKMQMPDFGRH
jgi:hypothetical protein